jgi:hypothetical protein
MTWAVEDRVKDEKTTKMTKMTTDVLVAFATTV